MFSRLFFVFAAGMCAFVAIAECQERLDSDLAEFTFKEEVRHAFYEPAPPSVSNAMSAAVVEFCSKGKPASKSDDNLKVSWLCNRDNLDYFRTVYIDGFKSKNGIICPKSKLFRYMPDDLAREKITAAECVKVELNKDSHG